MTTRTVAVVGASRGLGRATAEAFAADGTTVIALARTGSGLLDLQRSRPGVVPLLGDARDTALAAEVIGRGPDVVVLVAGATPAAAPFDEQSWEEFSRAWETDVRLTHTWLAAALRHPAPRGSRVIVTSSGAALNGSPLSGGYAGAKATQRFLAAYAQEESLRRGLGLTFSAVLPRITPATEVGDVASRGYAERQGISQADHIAQLGPTQSPEDFGAAIVELSRRSATDAAGSFLLTPEGTKKIS